LNFFELYSKCFELHNYAKNYSCSPIHQQHRMLSVTKLITTK